MNFCVIQLVYMHDGQRVFGPLYIYNDEYLVSVRCVPPETIVVGNVNTASNSIPNIGATKNQLIMNSESVKDK